MGGGRTNTLIHQLPPNRSSVDCSSDTANAANGLATDSAKTAVEEATDVRLPTLTDDLHGSSGSVIETKAIISSEHIQCLHTANGLHKVLNVPVHTCSFGRYVFQKAHAVAIGPRPNCSV